MEDHTRENIIFKGRLKNIRVKSRLQSYMPEVFSIREFYGQTDERLSICPCQAETKSVAAVVWFKVVANGVAKILGSV
jgi:hypothetical protein